MSTSIPPVTPASPEVAELTQSLKAVQQWVEARQYQGYDPGDGLTSFLRPLTLERPLAQRLLQQLVWKSPINIRPLVGVRAGDSTKGRGFMAWGYLLRHRVTGNPVDLARAEACLDWLDQHRVPDAVGHCWGNHFDFVTRSGCIPAHEPTIVWSGLIGQAFLEAFEQTGRARFLETADSICRWVLTLPREETPTGTCLSYVGFKQSSIHNSNMLGGALLARTWKHTGDERLRTAARSAMAYSCSRQRPDGSWWYGEEEKYHWIDNFHTGYNLDSLKRYIEGTGDQEFVPALAQGYRYFKDTFFEPDGCPRYYHNRKFPVDIQCAAQAIDTFSFFADHDSSALASAVRVARWTVRHLQDPTGYFYYRRLPLFTVRTPYFHWGQATTFKALAHLLGRLNR